MIKQVAIKKDEWSNLRLEKSNDLYFEIEGAIKKEGKIKGQLRVISLKFQNSMQFT